MRAGQATARHPHTEEDVRQAGRAAAIQQGPERRRGRAPWCAPANLKTCLAVLHAREYSLPCGEFADPPGEVRALTDRTQCERRQNTICMRPMSLFIAEARVSCKAPSNNRRQTQQGLPTLTRSQMEESRRAAQVHGFIVCVLAGRLVLEEAVVDPEHEARWMEYCNRHRCDSQSRGSVYDSKAGADQTQLCIPHSQMPSQHFMQAPQSPTQFQQPSVPAISSSSVMRTCCKLDAEHKSVQVFHVKGMRVDRGTTRSVCACRHLLPLLPPEEAVRRGGLSALHPAHPRPPLHRCPSALHAAYPSCFKQAICVKSTEPLLHSDLLSILLQHASAQPQWTGTRAPMLSLLLHIQYLPRRPARLQWTPHSTPCRQAPQNESSQGSVRPLCEQRWSGAGKSECSRCHTAQGRFCRACLLVRYGLKLEDVLAAADTWLCPHCHEEDHPKEVHPWLSQTINCPSHRQTSRSDTIAAKLACILNMLYSGTVILSRGMTNSMMAQTKAACAWPFKLPIDSVYGSSAGDCKGLTG